MARWRVTGYRDYRVPFDCVVEAEDEDEAEEKAIGGDWQDGEEEDFLNADVVESLVEECERRS